MVSMSYCRFENTGRELSRCISDMRGALEAGQTAEQFAKKMSEDEERAFLQMRGLCVSFCKLYDEMLRDARRTERASTLEEDAAAVMAAVLGVSNTGQDYLFNEIAARRAGSRYFSPAEARNLLEKYRGMKPQPPATQIAEATVHAVAGHLFECDDQAEWFIAEARDWLNRVREMQIPRMRKIWPQYAPYVDALAIIGGDNENA